uniref:Secreted protein n=1 Tax=Oryza glumipatula TaxID=40148 RepID=A0A0E0ASK5_9ORYZ
MAYFGHTRFLPMGLLWHVALAFSMSLRVSSRPNARSSHSEGVRQTVATVGICPLYLVSVGVSGEATQQTPPEFIKRSLCRKMSES